MYWTFGARLRAFISPKTPDGLRASLISVELPSFNSGIVVNIAAQRRAQSVPARRARLLFHCTKSEIVILHCAERRTVFIHSFSTHRAYSQAHNEQLGAEKAPGRRCSSGTCSEWKLQQWTLYSVRRMIEKTTIIISGRHRLF